MKLAISGKGGVGKTTIAATLAKLFAESGHTVYAVDADPDACLAAAVGIPDEIIDKHVPVIEMKELVEERTGGDGAFHILNPKMDDILDDYSIQHGNIKYFWMAGIKEGGSACYCKENSFLRSLVGSLLLDKDDVVIMDMGAGIEHLSRGTARFVDYMLVVIEPSKNSVRTGKLVKKLAEDLGIRKVRFIGNKIRNEKEKEFIQNNFHADEILGFVAFDDDIWESAMDKGPAAELGGQLLESMKKIHDKILGEVGED